MLDLGFVPDAIITPVLNSPSGGIKAYTISSTLIAIRDEDSCLIEISL